MANESSLKSSLEDLLSRHWHHLTKGEVVTLLDADTDKGLDLFEVSNRRADYGHNCLSQKKGISPFILFVSQFNQPLVYILLGASLVTFVLNEWVDSAVIFSVVLINALIGYLQESKALKAIEALAQSMEGTARVIRAGEVVTIASSELVPGDLVLLQSGDKVPADLRLLQIRELKIDESALTGESLPCQKSAGKLPKETVLAERNNMAYSSTLVTYGTGLGLVIATGDHSEMGRINVMVAEAAILATPLTLKITEFSQKLLWIILVLSGLTFLASWIHGNSLLDSFLASVALAVSVIPEGLPAAMTIMLAIGVSKMAKRHAIIRKMPAVETLGSTTIICSDKTGTLTQNQMTVQQVYSGSLVYDISGVGYQPEGSISVNLLATEVYDLSKELNIDRDLLQHSKSAYQVFLECLTAGLLCNDARLRKVQGTWFFEGDPTELAMVSVAAKAGLFRDSFLDHKRLDTLPFESQYQYMATLYQHKEASIIYIKGSVEAVLERCIDLYGDSVDPLDRELILKQVAVMAKRGLRILAFARKELGHEVNSVSHADIDGGLSFLGLQAMMDPPRPEAISAVAACQKAGIQVKMITGDHVITAAAIAQQIGLNGVDVQKSNDFAINGRDLALLSDQDLVDVAQRITVFARVSPEQKLRLVEALQVKGHVVAMTGDGVNDAPALKQANIGVAMGIGGTEVAKEAADMILTNDNFATIEAAVEEGRAVFDNLIKFITWTLPTNVGEGLVVLVAVLFGLTLPITPVQILWINMTTAIFLGMMLAFEHKEPGIMERPPRSPNTPVITRALAFRIGLVSVLLLVSSFGLFDWALREGKSLENARTLAVNMFVFGEMFYLLNCRSLRLSMFKLGFFSNRWLLLGVVCMTLLQLLFTYSSVMNQLFGSAPLNLSEWGLILLGSWFIYTAVSVEKFFRAVITNRQSQR
ncbi:MAG: cation-transporting P-type ATPase F [Thiomicrorhabdus sp.]|nr:MAG: cation-transporting P-type ATPase F [Thiomicrorhabdus sp.]